MPRDLTLGFGAADDFEHFFRDGGLTRLIHRERQVVEQFPRVVRCVMAINCAE
jgi:hypothetical protein